MFPGNNLINFTLNTRQLTLPSLCSPSLEDVDDKADDNTHVGDEAEGHDVIPSGGGEYSVDEVLVVAIFPNTRAAVQLSVTVTREALKIFFYDENDIGWWWWWYLIIVWSGAGMAAVVTRQTGSATVGDSLKYKVKSHQQIILEEIKKTGKNVNISPWL